MPYVIMLSTIMPYVIMLNVVAPIPWLVCHNTEEKQLSHRPRSQGKSFSTTPIHIVVKKTVSVQMSLFGATTLSITTFSIMTVGKTMTKP